VCTSHVRHEANKTLKTPSHLFITYESPSPVTLVPCPLVLPPSNRTPQTAHHQPHTTSQSHILQVNSTQNSNQNPNPILPTHPHPALKFGIRAWTGPQCAGLSPPSAVDESRSSERRRRPLRRQPHGRAPRPRLIRFYRRQFHRQEEGPPTRRRRRCPRR
jgi:hypothetical protein